MADLADAAGRLVAVPIAALTRFRGAEPMHPRGILSAAVGRGPWRPFGTVTLGGPSTPPDPELPFDAVQHPPPGLVADGPLARFRRPAYAAARAARGVALETGPR
jgi:hypothetical protein